MRTREDGECRKGDSGGAIHHTWDRHIPSAGCGDVKSEDEAKKHWRQRPSKLSLPRAVMM